MSYTAQQKHSVLHKKHTFLCNTEYLLNKIAQNKEVKNRNPLPLEYFAKYDES